MPCSSASCRSETQLAGQILGGGARTVGDHRWVAEQEQSISDGAAPAFGHPAGHPPYGVVVPDLAEVHPFDHQPIIARGRGTTNRRV
jgi:hypothetical protein